MNCNDWKNEIDKLTIDEVKRYFAAIDMLSEWGTFRKEFKDTGIFLIKAMLESRLFVYMRR